MIKIKLFFLALIVTTTQVYAQDILVPMDERQTDHLKSYGVVYWLLGLGQEVDWLLNYRGGSFLMTSSPQLERELLVRGIAYERISVGESNAILNQVESDGANTAVVKLEKSPRIAVYAPEQTLPWDDAVLLALTYAEVPYEQIYDKDILTGRLQEFDWLHLHHEDFTGQYGKFYARFRNAAWYIEQQRLAEKDAKELGFQKVSQLKLAVAQTIQRYVGQGGFLFSMCSGTDTIDIALAAHNTDIVPSPLDGDPVAPDAMQQLDYAGTFAFQDFTPIFNPMEYEHSDIDVTPPPQLQNQATDFFTLFDFSAKWDPVPTMLTQDHVATVRGFMGQTTTFKKNLIKENVVILAEAPGQDRVKYLYSAFGKGFFTFYAGHDPEDYQHFVGDPPTDLKLHKNSPGYRLILNNILFPAAKKKPQKT